MYKITAFLLLQFSLNRYRVYFKKSARISHFCLNLGLNYICTAQFYQSDNQNITFLWTGQIFFYS